MKLYIIEQESKEGKKYKRVILKMTNDMTGEEIFYSGFLNELETIKSWGDRGWLEAAAELTRDRPPKKEK
jgi:hypothetical protein